MQSRLTMLPIQPVACHPCKTRNNQAAPFYLLVVAFGLRNGFAFDLEVAFLLRKSLKPFPLGDLENTDWPSVLVVLGLGIVLVQRPDLVAELQSNLSTFLPTLGS